MKPAKRCPLCARFAIAVATLSLFSALAPTQEGDGEKPRAPGEEPGWTLVWSDEFEKDGAPDSSKWVQEEGFIRNREEQYYTKDRRENARVEDGVLVIEARKESYPNARYDANVGRDWRKSQKNAECTSASLTTKGKASWKRGRVEVRAKIPQGRGVWPAIWMLGNNIDEVGWPACGEIDIMEYVGFAPDTIHANIHTKKYNHTKGTGKGDKRTIKRPYDDFHVWALEWTDTRLEIFVDDEKLFAYEKESNDPDVWPFDKPHYLILNLAIGGSWGGQKGVDDEIFPQKLLIDYVRVYEREREGEEAAGGEARESK